MTRLPRSLRVEHIDLITTYITWMRTRGLSGALVQRRSSFLRSAEFMLGVALLSASTDQITALMGRLQQQGMCDATRHVYAGHLRTFYNWAIRCDHTRLNPVLNAAVPRRPRYLPRPIPDDSLMVAIASAEPRVRIVLILAALGALRACEIARLRREDVLDHLPEPALTVHGKGDRYRTVAASSALILELHQYGMPRHGPIIRRVDGSAAPVSPSLISSIANQHLHDVGFADTLHSLRHWSATALYQDTKDIRLVQETLGHSSPAVTAVYTAWSNLDAPAAMGRLADRLTVKEIACAP